MRLESNTRVPVPYRFRAWVSGWLTLVVVRRTKGFQLETSDGQTPHLSSMQWLIPLQLELRRCRRSPSLLRGQTSRWTLVRVVDLAVSRPSSTIH